MGATRERVARAVPATRWLPLVVALIGAGVIAAPQAPARGEPGCAPAPEVTGVAAPAEPSELAVSSSSELTIPFDSDRRPGARQLFLDRRGGGALPDTGTDLITVVGDITDEDGHRLHTDAVTAAAEVRGSRVRVRVCVDPAHPRAVTPGRYTGTVTIDDPRITGPGAEASTINVPLTVTARFAYPWLVWGLTVPAVLGATLVVWASHHSPGAFPRVGSALRHFQQWVLSHAVNVVVAAVAGGAVIITRFEADPTWGSGPLEFFELVGAGIGTVVTMLTGGQVLGAQKHRDRTDPAEAAAAAAAIRAPETDGGGVAAR